MLANLRSANRVITDAVQETYAADPNAVRDTVLVSMAAADQRAIYASEAALPMEATPGVHWAHLRSVLNNLAVRPNPKLYCGARSDLVIWDCLKHSSHVAFARQLNKLCS